MSTGGAESNGAGCIGPGSIPLALVSVNAALVRLVERGIGVVIDKGKGKVQQV